MRRVRSSKRGHTEWNFCVSSARVLMLKERSTCKAYIATFIYLQRLTNDSLIVAAREEFGIHSLATRNNDFDHVSDLTVYKPADI